MIFYRQEDLSTWRLVFLVPVILAFVVGFLSIFLTSETPVFLRNRKEELEKTEEEREKEKEQAKKDKTKSGGIKGAFNYIIHNKQLRWITIILLIFQVAIGVIGYENETMQFGNQPDNLNSMFLIIEPIVYAIFAFFSGFLSDWLGRKKSCFIFGIFGIIGEIGFILCCGCGVSGPVHRVHSMTRHHFCLGYRNGSPGLPASVPAHLILLLAQQLE